MNPCDIVHNLRFKWISIIKRLKMNEETKNETNKRKEEKIVEYQDEAYACVNVRVCVSVSECIRNQLFFIFKW